ncbi:alpha/beta hydrolase [Comamonas serinivorans]|uniref:Alpha/beta hydrolase n=1 Tax=Comamonas serinivorans TaxID=1082851 RepID=A0A1Y0EQK0_9BURK|nr:alpha/beta hydrolase [Comamonas serinivorans]ARU05681.1 alpha/beta hydrolase [Comamonas serinivorans]
MQTEPQLRTVRCADADGGHDTAYWQWGPNSAPHVVVCVHGLTRTGRDFDALAQALVARVGAGVRVICPDVVGRGQSDWLKNPEGYGFPQYVGDMLALLQQLAQDGPMAQLDWVGTSMGGLIGMLVAGSPQLPLPMPIRRLVLNDVGPTIEWSSLARIGSYLGKTGMFNSLDEATGYLKTIQAGFGQHTDAQWRALSTHMVRPLPEGGLTLHYDPDIALPFKRNTPEQAQAAEAAIWQVYEAITAQTLLIRGAQSDLLSPATAQRMGEVGPKARLQVFENVGHAPTLLTPEQTTPVLNFLLE